MNNILLKNIASMFGIQSMNYIIPLITLPYLVHKLGPESYGILGFSLALIQYFTRLTDYGFNLSATKEIASNKNINYVSKVYWSVFYCKLILLVISAAVLGLAIHLNDFLSTNKIVIWCSFVAVFGSLLFPIWLFQGLERMGGIAISNISARIISVPFIFIFVSQPEDSWVAALITSLTTILTGLIAMLLVAKYKMVKLRRISVADITFQFKSGFHIFVSTNAVSVYTTSVPVILGLISGPISVGYFVAADKLRMALQGLITPISQAVYPRIIYLIKNNKNQSILFVKRLFVIQAVLTLFITVTLIFAAPFIVSQLYGESYSNSILILQILAPTIFLTGISNILGTQVLLTHGYNKVFAKIVIIAALASLIIIFPLVLMYSEFGAAISIVITEIIVALLMMVAITRLNINPFRRIE
ncbi:MULTISPECIES: flippase [Escherichia]|uniref:flippase n=2 Tax=Enterobacteriaceae TaxID=543 RepID=UPI001CE4044A|nr:MULTISPECIES: flippase [Escherichia]